MSKLKPHACRRCITCLVCHKCLQFKASTFTNKSHDSLDVLEQCESSADAHYKEVNPKFIKVGPNNEKLLLNSDETTVLVDHDDYDVEDGWEVEESSPQNVDDDQNESFNANEPNVLGESSNVDNDQNDVDELLEPNEINKMLGFNVDEPHGIDPMFDIGELNEIGDLSDVDDAQKITDLSIENPLKITDLSELEDPQMMTDLSDVDDPLYMNPGKIGDSSAVNDPESRDEVVVLNPEAKIKIIHHEKPQQNAKMKVIKINKRAKGRTLLEYPVGKIRKPKKKRRKVESDDSELEDDEEESNSPQSLDCRVCNKTFLTKKDLKIHLIYHSTEEVHQCKYCGKQFQYSYELIKHTINHKNPSNICKICKTEFPNAEKLRIHFALHMGHLPFSCVVCDKGFKDNARLKSHLSCHSEDRPFVCRVCGKGFRRKSQLSTHMWVHSKLKPFRCEFCNREFNYKCNMQLHIQKIHNVIHN